MWLWLKKLIGEQAATQCCRKFNKLQCEQLEDRSLMSASLLGDLLDNPELTAPMRELTSPIQSVFGNAASLPRAAALGSDSVQPSPTDQANGSTSAANDPSAHQIAAPSALTGA